ncbi:MULTISPECIES: host cell division inhibitor Icd-like protein [Enterobacterales]|uniref:host cell division inhibitor Icd-like protein n=1 Tax=Enterobacterales TaxID=91347 RepID=UPI002EDABE32
MFENHRPLFTWLFLASYASPDELPTVLRIEADTEEEARNMLTGSWHLTFAAKINSNSPLKDCAINEHWASAEGDNPCLWSVIATDAAATFAEVRGANYA